jgi:uncharacterized protein (TIGR00369 family)
MARKRRIHGHGTRTVPLKKNHCFACGKDNPGGMHLKFVLDHERMRFVSRFRLSKRFTGPPGFCHGGIIATILDDAMSKLNKLRDAIAPTSQLTIRYLKPVPLHAPLRVESWELRKSGRELVHTAEILNEEGTVLARGRGVFVIIDPKRFKRR